MRWLSAYLMPTLARPTGTFWQRLTLVVSAPIVFLLLFDVTLRVSGVDTDIVRNENFEIGVPAWLFADESWVDIQRGRLEQPGGVRAEDVSWLRHFKEARYIQYKLKPNVEVDAVNPFNPIEVRKGTTFHFASNSQGFRTKEFEKKSAVARIVTIGDSSTFGWGVDDEFTFQALLERRFDRGRDTAAEVLNLGMSGHTSRHGLGMFEHYVRELDPDVLVISYGANDARYVLQPVDEMLDRVRATAGESAAAAGVTSDSAGDGSGSVDPRGDRRGHVEDRGKRQPRDRTEASVSRLGCGVELCGQWSPGAGRTI